MELEIDLLEAAFLYFLKQNEYIDIWKQLFPIFFERNCQIEPLDSSFDYFQRAKRRGSQVVSEPPYQKI